MGHNHWWAWWDSNPHCSDFKSLVSYLLHYTPIKGEGSYETSQTLSSLKVESCAGLDAANSYPRSILKSRAAMDYQTANVHSRPRYIVANV